MSAVPLNLHRLAKALDGEVTGDQVACPGPNHGRKDRSLAVKLDPAAPDGFTVFSHAGDDFAACRDYVRDRIGMPKWQPGKDRASNKEYIYRDAEGRPYLRVTRTPEKKFWQNKWDGQGWAKGAPRPKIPYRLPELLAAESSAPVFICEGEKNTDAVRSIGLVATTNSEGAGKWSADLNQHLAGRICYVMEDNDEPGAAHVRKVAEHLGSVAAEVRIVKLPGLAPKGDVGDWVAAGGEATTLLEMCQSAPGPSLASGDNIGLVTEDEGAILFAERHRGELRYCSDHGSWFRWDGSIWRQNKTGLAFHWARELARQMAEGQDRKTETTTRKATFAGAVERFARSDPTFAVTAEIWDRDPMLLGTPGGTVDLKTGLLRPARPEDGITKTTAVSPSDTAECQLWRKFLRETFNGDDDVILFLQRYAGYSLTGLTREHALVFGYGAGGNGKSVFVNVKVGILADYATTAAMDVFIASNTEKHTTDIAMLRGARLVTASETEEGRQWAESRIKQLTGGDRVTARFMRQNNFSFRPAFKLLFVGNHKPGLRNVDEAARRRFNLVPFTRKPNVPDRDLEEKLKAEWPGILRWMVEGCLDWQRNGLQRPETIREATDTYFEEQDVLGEWLTEKCIVDHENANRMATTGELFASWTAFAKAANEPAGAEKAFAQKLEKAGFYRKAKVPAFGGGRARGFSGIELRSDPQLHRQAAE